MNGRTDGETDMTKLILACQNFVNAHNNKNLYNQKNSRKRHVDVFEEGLNYEEDTPLLVIIFTNKCME